LEPVNHARGSYQRIGFFEITKSYNWLELERYLGRGNCHPQESECIEIVEHEDWGKQYIVSII
jgi:hypothetical protein